MGRPTPSDALPATPSIAAAELRIRVRFGAAGMLGPGKAELLEKIGETGSIAAAGRDMGMSYRRAWALVETLNGMFREPVVERVRGGARGGGARVTDTGRAVIDAYRGIERDAASASERNVDRLRAMLRDAAPGGGPE